MSILSGSCGPAITYADNYELIERPVPRRGMLQLAPGQGEDGYGSKISTDKMLRFNGDTKLYRVYCICYSNAGSCYVIVKGERLYLRG